MQAMKACAFFLKLFLLVGITFAGSGFMCKSPAGPLNVVKAERYPLIPSTADLDAMDMSQLHEQRAKLQAWHENTMMMARMRKEYHYEVGGLPVADDSQGDDVSVGIVGGWLLRSIFP